MFVVDENIARPDRMQSRRAVLDFLGRHVPTNIVLDGNVMLSVFFNSESFPDSTSEIEVWGWDAERGRYNYYKLDSRGTPDKKPAWKFRGSSVDADLLNADERNDTCLQCHINGAPIMKELLFPWNNWRSFKFTADYLKTNWPVGKSQRLQQLSGAEDLETTLLASIRQFNTRRLNAALARRPDNGDVMTNSSGNARMVDGVRMLKHLFVTTEVNLISSGQLSGLHPLEPKPSGRPDNPVDIPDSFFLNANLLAGGGITAYSGLGIAEARGFRDILRAGPADYASLVRDPKIGLKLAGQSGDANFAWFVPEPSHADNSMVDEMMRRGVVSAEFVAAVLAIDVEQPVFSAARERLLKFVPKEFNFPTSPGARTQPDDLTRQTIDRLRAAGPPSGSVEADFLGLLESKNSVDQLRDRVTKYRARVTERLKDAATKDDELRRLFIRATAVRRAMVEHPLLGPLDETGDRLLPLP